MAKTTTSPIIPNTTLKLTLLWSDVAPEYNSALKRLAKRLKTDGFRKGKIPAQLAESIVGHDRIAEEALDKLLPKAYSKLLSEAKKTPMTYPDIKPVSITKGQDWELTVEIAEKPAIKVDGYEALTKKAHKTAEAELKKLSEAAKQNAEGAKDDPKTAVKPGKKAPVAAKPLSDAERKDQLLKVICGTLVSELQPQVPELLVRTETRRDLEQLVKTLDQLNMSLDNYLARRGQTFEQLSGEMAATALARLQLEFILQAIGEKAKLTATAAEIDNKIAQIENAEVRAQYGQNPEYRSYLTNIIVRDKTLDHLIELAK